ncbi:30S ribosomal protein S10, chloroplastic [Morella rubra]|uniref:30S ribosomal protein S10, chloroplastic n=2 Tax=Morella rubra TaxID=262757 RepID=A0A6A1UVH4_9ROSI|nr:30S ribosomal protein S10, chloroplastic [Morella rubra]
MAVSSFSTTLIPSIPLKNSSPFPSKPTFSYLSFYSAKILKPKALKPSPPSTVVFAAPEVLESPETLQLPPETPDGSDSTTFEVGDSGTPSTSSLSISADSDTMAPKQKIRIKLRSYWVPLIEDSCKQIMDAARTTNAKTVGPVPLPTKKRIYCVLKSPHVHKDARFHFEIRTHQRLIDILYPTAQTIDSLMQLDLPAGVDVEGTENHQKTAPFGSTVQLSKDTVKEKKIIAQWQCRIIYYGGDAEEFDLDKLNEENYVVLDTQKCPDIS